ncbi:hypothetical protein CABS01_10155 [Colletotrichum abscissum]|uniref:uncharacterized protein n=1 Tax=Colletotrichum abscissum TaxID=1671311 RepID=UPI0027D71A91|nr:uncharacterized protein CABS01_10155 [Colletotrichum abscissum]KAK1500431.1 hypothetical protein CABS01_10155 [Colletotrichum abscissum]
MIRKYGRKTLASRFPGHILSTLENPRPGRKSGVRGRRRCFVSWMRRFYPSELARHK